MCLIGLLLAIPAPAAEPAPSRTLIRNVHTIYELTEEEAKSKLPVQFEADVLYSDTSWNMLWIHDATGRLFIDPRTCQSVPKAHTRIRIDSSTSWEDGRTILIEPKFTHLGSTDLVPPAILMLPAMEDPAKIPPRVMLAGTVIEAGFSSGHLKMVIAYLQRFQVAVIVKDASPDELKGLLGAQVEVAGCPTSLGEHTDPHASKIKVFVPNMEDVAVFQPGLPDPFLAPQIPLSRIRQEYENRKDPRLIRVEGEIISKSGDDQIVIKSDGTSTTVHLVNEDSTEVGQKVQTVGSIWKESDGTFSLTRALVRIPPANAETAKGLPSEPLVLQTAQAVRSLSPEEPAKAYSVELNGVVTYYDPDWRVLFVQDGTGGIYVNEKNRRLPIKLGDRVKVTGTSSAGGFAPMVEATSVQKQGEGTLPAARRVHFGRMLSGAEDSQWVQIEGTIEKATRSQKNIQFHVHHPESDFDAVLMGAGPQVSKKNWVGSRVRLTGVCGVKANADRQPVGIYFHIPNLEHLEFLKVAPKDPFDIALTPINELLHFDADDPLDLTRVKIAGRVTYTGDSGMVAIQDATKAIMVEFTGSKVPGRGSYIEVIGFPRPGHFSPELRQPKWREATGEFNPEPVFVPATAALNPALDSSLVRLEAEVVESHPESSPPSLILNNGRLLFTALLPDLGKTELEERFPKRSVVSASGVLSLQADAWHKPRSFHLIVPTQSDIQVLAKAPWLTKEFAIVSAQGFGLVAVCGLVWIYALRTRVARQTNRIRTEMEQKGRLSARYDTLVKNANDLIFTLNSQGRFTSMNPAAKEWFEGGESDLSGSLIYDFLGAPSAHDLKVLIESPARPTGDACLEIRRGEGEEEQILDVCLSKDPESASGEIQCIARDVTERRRLERQVLQMQKMESVGQLAAGAAHDYNNLMTIILANAEMLKDSEVLEGEDAETLSDIFNAAERAATVTDQLLSFSRKQAMNFKRTQAETLLMDLGKLLQRMLGETHRLELTIAPDLPEMMADAGMIQQAVTNLVLNARDAMEKGGSIQMDLKHVFLGPDDITGKTEALPGDYIVISVSDQGTGIPSSDHLKIFEPFFTTKETGKGTGLGLSSVFGITKQHEGWVELESEVGEGSTFRLYIPTADPAVHTREAPATNTVSSSPLQATLLVVEDEEEVRRTKIRLLMRAGFTTVEAASGPEALKRWEEHRETIDLLITDMRMPGNMTGLELAKEIRIESPDLPIIYCTGYSEDLPDVSLLSKLERILPKPYEGKMLTTLVSELLHESRCTA